MAMESSNQTSTATNTSGSLLPLTIPEDSGTDLTTYLPASGGKNTKANNRLSLPVGAFSKDTEPKSPEKSGGKIKSRKERRTTIKNKLHETSIMEEGIDQENEIRLFEQQHCLSAVGALELSGDEYSSSPPTRFYKKNAKPYHERLFAKTPTANTPEKKRNSAEIDNATPQRRNNIPDKPTRRKKNNAPTGPIPKIRNSLNCSKAIETDTVSEVSHLNGSYKNYDINSSSIYDEYVISSRAYKGNMKHSHTYQTVVNKHGEIVEYALPLVDEEKNSRENTLDRTTQLSVDKTANADTINNSQAIDENFKFLTDESASNLNFSDSVRKYIVDPPSRPNKNLQVTDLDSTQLEKGKGH